MSEAARELPYTLEDWIELEKTAHVRHEFEDGVFRAMTGGSTIHNVISGNIFATLRLLARARGCTAYIGDVKTIADGNGYYPDVMVTCESSSGRKYVEYSPCLIVEVLSPSTQNRDQGIKRHNYMKMLSLEQYVLVHTFEKRVEIYRRREGYWQFTELTEPTDALEVVCLGDSISLEQIYEYVILEPETQESPQD